MIPIRDYIENWSATPFGAVEGDPWDVTRNAPEIIASAIAGLGRDFDRRDGIAVHRSATVEPGAILKPPVLIGANCFVGHSAYLRGGVFLGDGCVVGPACEVKTTILCAASKIAHLGFVGDSILGEGVNIEAGAVVANYRNEMANRAIRILWRGQLVETGVEKFGALIGDNATLGANAVVAPGAILERGYRLGRLGLVDQHPDSADTEFSRPV